MAILIDGYNLMNVSGVYTRGPKPLERSRYLMLDFLVEHLPADQLAGTTVVFDAKQAPPGLPREFRYGGLRVVFAATHDEADDLIEELIDTDPAPQKLTVVSSDRRLQRAARRRKATAVGAEPWYEQVVAAAEQRRRNVAGGGEQPPDGAAAEADDDELRNPFPPGYAEDLLDERDSWPFDRL